MLRKRSEARVLLEAEYVLNESLGECVVRLTDVRNIDVWVKRGTAPSPGASTDRDAASTVEELALLCAGAGSGPK